MKEEDKRQCATSDELRTASVNELIKKHPKAFVHFADNGRALIEKFIRIKLNDFPRLCKETRRVNYLKWKQLREMGDGKGWSPSKEFKFDYEIPRELYFFMINMVYRNFWSEEQEKVWRKFMKGVVRGDDPAGLLREVKVEYGQVATQPE